MVAHLVILNKRDPHYHCCDSRTAKVDKEKFNIV